MLDELAALARRPTFPYLLVPATLSFAVYHRPPQLHDTIL